MSTSPNTSLNIPPAGWHMQVCLELSDQTGSASKILLEVSGGISDEILLWHHCVGLPNSWRNSFRCESRSFFLCSHPREDRKKLMANWFRARGWLAHHDNLSRGMPVEQRGEDENVVLNPWSLNLDFWGAPIFSLKPAKNRLNID